MWNRFHIDVANISPGPFGVNFCNNCYAPNVEYQFGARDAMTGIRPVPPFDREVAPIQDMRDRVIAQRHLGQGRETGAFSIRLVSPGDGRISHVSPANRRLAVFAGAEFNDLLQHGSIPSISLLLALGG